jgi:hypothetical protein
MTDLIVILNVRVIHTEIESFESLAEFDISYNQLNDAGVNELNEIFVANVARIC